MFESVKNEEREKLYRLIVESIRSSFNIDEVKKSIVNILGKTLNADRCFIMEYDKTKDEFLPINSEYLSSKNILPFKDLSLNKNIPTFISEFKKSKILIITEKKNKFGNEFIDINNKNFEAERKVMEDYNAKSAVAFPIYYSKEFLGTLVIHYVNVKQNISIDEINLLKTVSSQIAIAIYQSKLYKTTKMLAERETLLRKIIETIRSTIDINNLKKMIVMEIAKSLNAERCFIIEYNPDIKKFLPVTIESSFSAKIKSIIGFDLEKEVPELTRRNIVARGLVITDIEKFLIENDFINTSVAKHFRRYGVKSGFSIPIYYANQLLGILAIHYLNKKGDFIEDELQLVKAIANQIGIAINQANLYKNEIIAKERESSLRKIIEASRKSLVFEDVLMDICKTIIELFNVGRVVIAKLQEEDIHKFAVIEYTQKNNKTPAVNFNNFNTELAVYWRNYLAQKGLTKVIFNINEADLPQGVKQIYQEIGVKAIVCLPLIFENLMWGCLFLSFYDSYKEWDNGQIELFETVASQVCVAIRQSELYSELNETKANLTAILDNIPYWAWIKDKESKYIIVNKKYAESKNLTVDNLIGKSDFDEFPKEIAEKYRKDDKEVMVSRKIKTIGAEETIINGEKRFLETYKQPFLNAQNEVIGTIGIAKDITERKEAELELLHRQEQIIKSREREHALRIIVDIIRSSLDIDEIKEKVVNEIGKYFNANRCFIYEFGEAIKSGIYKEYVSSPKVKRMSEVDFEQPQFKYWRNFILDDNLESRIIIPDLNRYIIENNLIGTPMEEHIREFNIKTDIRMPIIYADELYGRLAIQYTEKNVNLEMQDIDFLKDLVAQVGIAIHQAKLYKFIQSQAEWEKINRNIVEILRRSIDKTMIKKLFVKNIWKLLGADIVYLSEYNSNKKMYMPIDKNSEYLSGYKEKSFENYDWTSSDAKEYIQPLLAKEELNIFYWDEYIKKNEKSRGFINLFKEARIKSSYNLPIMYQQSIIGFLSINFTGNEKRLSEEDLQRLRDICTQAAVALYQAKLYLQAQQCVFSRESFRFQLAEEIKEPINKIIQSAKDLSEEEIEKELQIKYLENIIINCNELLELTQNISDS